MLMPFAEPVASRYIYIDPETNQVHLLVPVIGDQEILTSDTCKSIVAMDNFFKDGAALKALNDYKLALEFDLRFIDDVHPLKEPKQVRLAQINAYIAAIPIMQDNYLAAITRLLQTPSNLYSMQFVRHQDSICIDFTALASPSLHSTWAQHHYHLPSTNEHIKANVDLDIEKLISSTQHETFDTLPMKIKLECMKSPTFQLRTVFHRGKFILKICSRRKWTIAKFLT